MEKGALPDTLSLKKMLLAGRTYAGLFELLSLDKNGLLKYQSPNQEFLEPKKVLVLPKVLYEDTIKLAHLTGGHMATEQTIQRLLSICYFPSMRAEVDSVLSYCEPCQKKLGKQKDQRHTMVVNPTGYPFMRIHVGKS